MHGFSLCEVRDMYVCMPSCDMCAMFKCVVGAICSGCICRDEGLPVLY